MVVLRFLIDLTVAVAVFSGWCLTWARLVRSNLLLLLLAAVGYYLAGCVVDRVNRLIDARLSPPP